MEKLTLILLSGHPATGKTTISKKIAGKFKLPVVSPDSIKEIIWDCVGWEHDKEEWNKFGKASFEVMYYFIQENLSKNKSIVVDAHFNPEINNERINNLKDKYGCEILQIYCNARKEVIIERFKNRIRSDNYHSGHKHGIDMVYTKEEYFSKIGEGDKRLAINGKTLEVDTTNVDNIDYDKIFNFISDNK